MKRMAITAVTALAIVMPGMLTVSVPQPAAAQSATAHPGKTETDRFAVDNMTCALCPVTVRKAMEGVHGVQSVEVDLASKTATVTFDPSLATPRQIAAASRNAGYPARKIE